MNYEFMITGTPLPPCIPLPRATLRLPVSSTAKVMYARLHCFVGFKGDRFRFYLSDESYWNAKHSKQEGEIRIKSYAAIVTGKLYPDQKPRQQER